MRVIKKEKDTLIDTKENKIISLHEVGRLMKNEEVRVISNGVDITSNIQIALVRENCLSLNA